jgi:hypothetical protein
VDSASPIRRSPSSWRSPTRAGGRRGRFPRMACGENRRERRQRATVKETYLDGSSRRLRLTTSVSIVPANLGSDGTQRVAEPAPSAPGQANGVTSRERPESSATSSTRWGEHARSDRSAAATTRRSARSTSRSLGSTVSTRARVSCCSPRRTGLRYSIRRSCAPGASTAQCWSAGQTKAIGHSSHAREKVRLAAGVDLDTVAALTPGFNRCRPGQPGERGSATRHPPGRRSGECRRLHVGHRADRGRSREEQPDPQSA